MDLSVIENDPKEVKKYLQNFVPINYYKVLDDAYLHQIRAVLLHSVSHAELYNPVYAGLINDLTVTSGKNYAIVNTKIEGLVDNFSALATKTETLEVEAANANASIIEIQQASAEQNKAQASFNQRLEASLDDIVVGGRNIMKNSDFSKGYRAWQEASITQHNHFIGTMHKISTTGIVGSLMGIYPLAEYQNMAMVEGTEYSISFYAYGSILLMDEIYLTSPSEAPIKLPSVVISTDLSERRHITFTAPTGGGGLGLIFGATATSEDDWFSISRIKVELGNKPTDWTPAPEDVEGYINEVQSSIDTFKDVQVERNLATAQAIEKMDTRVKGNAASILEEKNTRVDQFSALSQVNTELTSKTKENEAAIKTVDLTFTDRFNSSASRLEVLEADNSLGKGKIENLESVTTTLGEVVVSQGSTLNAKINNLTMGGRNLLRNSDFKLGVDTWGTSAITNDESIFGNLTTVTNTGTTADYFGLTPVNVFKTVTLIKDKEYVLSFYAKGNIPSINDIWITTEGELPQQLDSVDITDGISDRYSIVFTANHTTEAGSIIIGASGYAKGKWFAVAAVKLEIGNKATDWTEAPEDTKAFIHDVEANINEFKEVQVNYNEAKALQLLELTTKTDNNIAEISELRETTSNIEGSTAALETKLRGEYVSAISSTKSDITKATDGKIDEVKKTITEMSVDISSKADITRVDSVENTANQSLAAAKTEITSSYTSAISTVRTDSATDATNKANKAKTDANTYTDGKVTTLTTLIDSKANISRVDEVENNANKALASTKSELTTEYTKSISKAIEDIEVGGRNLFSLNKFLDITPAGYYERNADKLTILKVDTNAGYPLGELEANTDYILTTSVPMEDRLRGTDKKSLKGHSIYFTTDENNTEVSFKFLPVGFSTDIEYPVDVYVKLEKGNIATDFTLAPEDVTDYINSEIDKVTTKIDSKADISRVDSIESNAIQSIAQAKTDLTSSYTSAISTVKSQSATDAQNKANKALADANSNTVIKANEAQTAAEVYALAKAKAEADAALALAKGDATSKSNAAKSAAIAAAALDAKNKADKALADAKIDATAKAEAAKLYAKGLVDTLTIVVNSKADITRVDKVVNDSTQALAEAKTDIKGAYTLAITESSNLSAADAKAKADKALADATIKATQAQTAAETYALAQANAKAAAALDSAKSDATTKANKAKADAELAAALDAKNKADEALRLAKLDATAKADAVKVMVVALTKVVDSKASISRVDTIENTATQALATAKTELIGSFNQSITETVTNSEEYARLQAEEALKKAKLDATAKADAAKSSAEIYAAAQAEAKRIEAEAYADGIVTAEEERAIEDANLKLEQAKTDATTKANAAEQAAKQAAALDATSKANKALLDAKADSKLKADAARDAAQVFATAEAEAKRILAEAYADDVVTVEEARAIKDANDKLALAKADATTKANAAKAAAERAAALDATAKANKALADAKTDSANKVAALRTIVDSKASVTSVEKVVNDANQALAAVEGKITSAYSKAIEEIEVGGRNLIITSEVLIGKYILESTGAVASAGTHNATDFIEVLGNANYTLSNLTKNLHQHRIVYYDSTKTRISGTLYSGAQPKHITVTTPSNCAFVRISGDNTYSPSKDWKFEKGNKATDWTPAPEDVTNYIDSEVGKLNTTIDSKADINTVNKVVSDANQSLAEMKTTITGEYTTAIGTAKTASALDAKTKADKALADAKTDATTKANNAKTAAAEYTRLEAKAKADAALALASDDATVKANAAKSAAELAAAKDAKAKADKALADAKVDATAKASAAEKAAKDYADTKAVGLTTLINSKADISRVDSIENNATQALATAKTELTGAYTTAIATAKSQSATDAQTRATKALTDAKADTVLKANAAQAAAKTYALAEAKAKADAALVTAKSDATTKANAAESAAKVAAALDAKNKADKALADAKIDSKAKADEAERLAKAHADTKVTALTKIVDSKASITSVEKVANDATQALATTNTNLTTKFKEAKDYSDLKSGVLVISSNTKKFINPASYSVDTATITGYLVIETPITPARMVNLKLSGFNYSGSSTVGLNLSFYNYTSSFINTGYESTGRYTIDKVQLAKKDTDKKAVIIIGLATSTWNYPKLVLEEVIVGYGSTPDSYLNEFSIRVTTDISGYTNLTNVSGVDLQGALQENSAAISTESKARSDADTALSSRITTLDTDYKGNKTAIRNELTAVSNKTNSTATSLGTLTTTVGGNTTKISQESTARSTADTALGNRITATDAIAKNAQSRVGTAETAISNATSAIATLRTDLVASYNIQDTRATNELPSYYYTNYPRQTVREFKQKSTMTGVVGAGTYVYLETVVRWSSDSGGAIVQTAVTDDNRIYIRTSSSATAWRAWVEQEDVTGSAAKVAAAKLALDNRINTTDARITSEKKVAADATSAVASTVSGLTTTVNGHTSSINETKSSLDGISAKWAMETNVNGKISGIYQHSTGKSSSVEILADKFSVGTDTTMVKPFTISGNDIVFNGKVSFNSVTGTVSSSQIPTGTINLNHMVLADRNKINTASTTAASAQTKANQAATAAATADSKAVTATTNAATAQTKANQAATAASTADSKAVAAQNATNTLKNNIYYPNTTTIDGGKIRTGSITAASGAIADLAVDTLQIAGNAITVSGIYYAEQDEHFNIAKTPLEVAFLNVNSAGGTVSIDFGFDSMRVYRYGAPGLSVIIEVLRGTEVLRKKSYLITNSKGTMDFEQQIFLPIVDKPPVGVNRYSVVASIEGTKQSDIRLSMTARTLVIRGAKDDRN